MDILHALGCFAARAAATSRTYLPLSDTGLTAEAMDRLIARKLAERDGRHAVYRLTQAGLDEAEDLGGPAAFSVDSLIDSARRIAPAGSRPADIARTAVLLTCDDDVRSALRDAVLALLVGAPAKLEHHNNTPTSGQRSGGGGGGSNGSAPTPGPSRWEQVGPALRSEGVIMTIGPGQTKVLADCQPADLLAAAAYYRGEATEATRRAGLCDALLEQMLLYEADTVADLERAHPDRLNAILT